VHSTRPIFNARSLGHPDTFCFEAAQGWLELGNPHEAREELDRIPVAQRLHPDALYLRWQISAELNEWSRCLAIARALTEHAPEDPRGWMALARCFQQKGKLEKAYRIAIDHVTRFPASWQMLYQTARYACLTGRPGQAQYYLELASAIGDARAIKLQAARDPDLATLDGKPTKPTDVSERVRASGRR
jgi:predicted Zn-dependent protease